MKNNYNRDMRDILRNLRYETVTRIAIESGFNSRQAMDNWLRRRGWKVKHQFVLVPIDENIQ
jgi:hypothetical protein